MRESKARPGPVDGMLSQACADRIAKDVAESCEHSKKRGQVL